MTRRERLLAKLEKRRQWAEGRRADSSANITRAIEMVKCIPMGQPILIGHHSERRHRRLLEKSDNAMRRGSESAQMAEHHESKAFGLAHALDSSIFSDDTDALDQLAARIAELEKRRDDMKRANKAYKAGGVQAMRDAVGLDLAAKGEATLRVCPYEKVPFPSYSLSNLGANIRRLKLRVEEVTKRNARQEKAKAAGGVVVEGTGQYVRVTFAEKPSRDTLNSLRDAGFRWGGGSWTGERAKLPAF